MAKFLHLHLFVPYRLRVYYQVFLRFKRSLPVHLPEVSLLVTPKSLTDLDAFTCVPFPRIMKFYLIRSWYTNSTGPGRLTAASTPCSWFTYRNVHPLFTAANFINYAASARPASTFITPTGSHISPPTQTSVVKRAPPLSVTC